MNREKEARKFILELRRQNPECFEALASELEEFIEGKVDQL